MSWVASTEVVLPSITYPSFCGFSAPAVMAAFLSAAVLLCSAVFSIFCTFSISFSCAFCAFCSSHSSAFHFFSSSSMVLHSHSFCFSNAFCSFSTFCLASWGSKEPAGIHDAFKKSRRLCHPVLKWHVQLAWEGDGDQDAPVPFPQARLGHTWREWHRRWC